MSKSLLLLGLLATGGCHFVASHEATPSDAAGGRIDLGDRVDRAVADAFPVDVEPALDVSIEVDSAPPCAIEVDGNTLALYTFEDSSVWPQLTDLVGAHNGSYEEGADQNMLYLAAGKPGCGMALHVEPNLGGVFDTGDWYATVKDSPSWDSVKSIDFWVSFTTAPLKRDLEAVLSRDAEGKDPPGHFVVQRSCNGALMVRLQNSGLYDYWVCSEPLEKDRWYHVGINFEAPEVRLYIDGTHTAYKGIIGCKTAGYVCGEQGTTPSIAGAGNPWVIGGATWYSTQGTTDKVTSQFGGAIDSLRISDAVRSFELPP